MPDARKRRQLIVPLFIPNQGCPHRCVYCRQEEITGQEGSLTPAGVERRLNEAIRSPGFDSARAPEIAFYGGTFTGMGMEEMEALLRVAHARVEGGPFERIRVSTRPDALEEDRLEMLRRYGVETVELGVQSMDDFVLDETRRGYRAADVESGAGRLRRFGFSVGVQLMPGLPGDSEARFAETVSRVIALEPDMVRLYPTLVLRHTLLARWYAEGRYTPLSLDRAVAVCAEACSRFEEKGIPVIRIGLYASASLLEDGGVLAGPWHPAFGFMARSAIYQKTLAGLLPPRGEAREIAIRVHPREVSLARGYRNRGLRDMAARTGADILKVLPDEDRIPYAPVVEIVAGPRLEPALRRPL